MCLQLSEPTALSVCSTYGACLRGPAVAVFFFCPFPPFRPAFPDRCCSLTNTLSRCARSLEHSTIMYESEGLKPLLRLSWNKQDANYLATVGLDSSTTTILDIR
jgi:hypothetical protein